MDKLSISQLSVFLMINISWCYDQKSKFFYPYFIETIVCKPFIFQNLNYVKSNGSSLKYPKLTLATGCKDN